MTDFLGLSRITARDPVKSFYFLCGIETALREQALDLIRAKVDPRPQDVQIFSALEHTAGEIWDGVLTYSDTAPRRFVLVRDAESLKDWGRFWEYIALLAAREAPIATIIFCSTAKNFGEWTASCSRGHQKSIELVQTRNRQLKQCTECSKIKTKIVSMNPGMYVECSTPGEVPAMKIVHGSFEDSWPGWLTCSRREALKIMEISGWDLTVAYDLCQKLLVTQVPITDRTLKVLVSRTSAESFVDELAGMRKGSAAGLARGLTPVDCRLVLGQLQRRVDLLSRLHRSLKRNEPSHALAQQLNVHYKLVEAYRSQARHYDADRVGRTSIALAKADAALHRGEDVGTLELLALLW